MFKLRSWIDETMLSDCLSLNDNAVEYLEEHPDKICYGYIGANFNAIHIVEKNIDRCDIDALCDNPNMITLLRNNRTLIRYSTICYHPHGIEFVEELIKNNELDKINWDNLSYNSAAIHILEQYPEKINWFNIICNENAEHLIRNNLENVEQYWYYICRQPHLIKLIEKHPEKIDWVGLTKNHNAIHLLKNNLEKIDIDVLRNNKNGFSLLLQLGHQFDDKYYNENIVHDCWDYCITHNIEFTLIKQLRMCGYTDDHFEFIKNHPIDYDYLSSNPHIFVYDYSRMKKTRQQQPWYQYIKNEFI